MNSIYPKRLLNFLAIGIMVLSVLVLSRVIGHLRNNIVNLSEIDKLSSYLSIGMLALILVCCVGGLMRKYWGWIGMTSYLTYTIGEEFYDRIKLGSGEHELIFIIPLYVFFVGVIIFLLSKTVSEYFKVNTLHKLLVFILPLFVYFGLNRDPIEDIQRVNLYYVDLVEEQFYLKNNRFTGILFSNHKNGNLQMEGGVEDGF